MISTTISRLLNKRLKELQAQAQVNTAYGVSTANTQVSPASTQVSTANLSDDTVYAFLASQPNGSQLVYEDLEQIHKNDIEEMDLKWDTLQGNAEDLGTKIAETEIKTVLEELYMVDDEVPTYMALMDFSDSEVHNDKTCSKTCLKSFETLKTQLDDLRIEFNKSEFNLATYKRGLASIEEQLVFYKKNEVIFCEQLTILKRDISYKDSELSMLKSELEKLKQEKESNQLKIENFDNAFKSLNKLIGSKIPDKSRKDVGFVSYNVVPPPPTGLFSPPKFDLSNSGLEEFQQHEFKGYGPNTSKSVSKDMSNEVKESPDTLLVKELVSDDKLEKKIVFPTIAKIEFCFQLNHEVFAPVARIEAIRLFLAYASFKDFVVYQMDVKSAFLYGKIEEEVYVCQPPRFEDPEFPDRVYKVEKALYGLHQAPRACYDKYVDEILKKFGFSTVKTASTPTETSKPLLNDAEAEDVDVHLYRSMIGSL
ncbi:ribonuclease H-like domain-containing protein [Tanacetum coccineum]